MNIIHKHYTYRVTWSVEDNELVRCRVDSPLGNPPFRNVGVTLSDWLGRIPVKINLNHFVDGGLPIGETALTGYKLNELKMADVLMNIAKNERLGSRGKVEDVVYTLFQSAPGLIRGAKPAGG